MHSNFVKRLLKAAWVLELVVAVLILAVTLLELFLLGEGTLSQVLGGSFSADAFFADAMTIVVGIEFVKMLMLHTPGRSPTCCSLPSPGSLWSTTPARWTPCWAWPPWP